MPTPSARTLCLAALVAALPASADYYFYGVADDDFCGDNDTLWTALEPYPEWDASRAVLRDNWNADDNVRGDGRDSLYDDLEWYADNLTGGDVFLFSYWGHGGWNGSDSYYPDEGSTARPQENDPSPTNSAPYQYDEYFGYSGSTYSMWDDDLTNTLADFDEFVEVIVISGACHSGGWVGGSHDLDTSTPATNDALYAMLAAPEQGTSIGVKESGETYYELLLCTALSNTVSAYMRMSDWYAAAMEYGATHTYTFTMTWDSSPQEYYFWPDEDWAPTAYEATYQEDHWGWQETYLQLRPEDHSWLSAEVDFYMCTPEPATAGLLVIGLLGLRGFIRRRRA